MYGSIQRPTSFRVRFSQGLEVMAHLLFLLFLLVCIVPIWPIRVLDPGWLLSLAQQILKWAGLTLVGLSLLELARQLTPWRRHLRARRALVLGGAQLASLGFVLMIPLQIQLAWLIRVWTPLEASRSLFPLPSQQALAVEPSLNHGLIALVYSLLFCLASRRWPRLS